MAMVDKSIFLRSSVTKPVTRIQTVRCSQRGCGGFHTVQRVFLNQGLAIQFTASIVHFQQLDHVRPRHIERS